MEFSKTHASLTAIIAILGAFLIYKIYFCDCQKQLQATEAK